MYMTLKVTILVLRYSCFLINSFLQYSDLIFIYERIFFSMSNKMFQGFIHQMHDAVGRTVGIIDSDCSVIACSNLDQVGEKRDGISQDFFTPASTFVVNKYTYKSFAGKDQPDYAVFVAGDDESAQHYASILAISLGNLKQFYDEKYDKNNFIKNVLLENILPGDVHTKAHELNFGTGVLRVCFFVRVTSKTEESAFEIIKKFFGDKNKDFVVNINEDEIAIVKEVERGTTSSQLEDFARSIIDTLMSEHYIQSCIGIGSVVKTIKDLSYSFKEAQVALEASRVFDSEKLIVSYDNLGIARLVYQLPTTLCKIFLKEVFRNGSIESLDQETLFTIQRFFENNLNISETSRKLFIHRNTLVYRLDKIKRLTALDLREFDDAIVFKIALMVKKYLNQSSQGY